MLTTTVALGLRITDGKLRVEKKFSMRGYNKRKVYDGFNNPFPYGSDIPDMNLPPIRIDDKPSHIKDPMIHHICSQFPSLLPLKIILVLLPPLIIFHNSFSYLQIILTSPIQ